MSYQELTGVAKRPLCRLIERDTLRSNSRARWLLAGCLLAVAYDAPAAAVFVVNTAGDPGPAGTTSLRQAIALGAESVASTTIVTFDNSLRNSTITLTQGVIVVGSAEFNLYIEGPGSRELTIAGNGTTPVLGFQSSSSKILSLSGLTVTNGKEIAGSGIAGGGCLMAKYSTLELNDVIVTGCTAGDYGGGVLLDGSTLSMVNATVTGNTSQRGGGGIQARFAGGIHSNIYLTDSTVSNNTTYGYGAGIASAGSNNVRITRSLISGNTVLSPADDATGGGGISLKQTYVQALILNSTIANNTAYAFGGGIGLFDAMSSQVTQVNFSTIVGNYSGFGYGGNGVHAVGTFSANSSIIANNFNRDDNVDIDGAVNADHTLILNIGSGHVSGQNNIFEVDPKLGALTFNGGKTLTFLPKIGSPVINAGGSAGTLHTDQRNLPRPVGTASDIGSVERQTIEDEIFRDGFESS
ncbi:MAG TPA: choice-of-anchor Q domain-containing protein [Rudaea sp.]|jgi:hypothetical protein|nr:choice-of-anchor Q domain-containing protein [Rudaea sp.]